jgi:hypothetical protein
MLIKKIKENNFLVSLEVIYISDGRNHGNVLFLWLRTSF